MIRNKLITIVALTAMVAMIQTAQASFVTDTLANLAGGATLSIGDKTFSNFSFVDSGLTSFNATGINVIAEEVNGIYYLRWRGNMSLVSSSGPVTAGLKLNYAVTAGPGWVINAIDQSYAGSAINGYLAVDETAAIGAFGGTQVGYSHLQVADFSDPPPEALDVLNIVPPQTTIYVTKDITFAVNQGFGFVTISQVAQSFHQVPEPTTMIAGALLLLPLGASMLRILRKRQTA